MTPELGDGLPEEIHNLSETKSFFAKICKLVVWRNTVGVLGDFAEG